MDLVSNIFCAGILSWICYIFVQSHNHNMEPVEEAIGSKNAGSQTQTPTMLDPHDHLHDDPLSGYSSAPEDVVRQKVPTHTKAEDLPQAVWQKIVSTVPQIKRSKS